MIDATNCMVIRRPPGYKTQRGTTSPNQVAATRGVKQNQSAFFASFNNDQYASLMTMLQSHLQASTSADSTSEICHVVGICLSVSTNSCSPKAWVIESRASCHVCYDQSMFIDLHTVDNISIILPTHMTFSVEFVGNVQLNEDILLTNVLLVPTFTHNLLSVSALLQDPRYSIIFSDNNCAIQDKLLLKTIGKVELQNGIYLLSIPQALSINKSALVCKVSFETWHRRLGHLSSSRLRSLKDIVHFKDSVDCICHVCPLAKQRRLSFPASNHVSENIFDLIHCDV